MNKKRIFTLLLIIVAVVFLFFPNKDENKYTLNTGLIFGTFYNIKYHHPQGVDLQVQIDSVLNVFNNSLSTFNPNSTISRINQNYPDAQTDAYFETMFHTARQLSELTNGAYDITIAPLDNAWGFGFSKKESITPELIDSLLQIVGYQKVRLENGKVIKENPAIMFDGSSIAKGYGCDVVADYLQSQGCEHFLVDIGGEIVLKGHNDKGELWKIGINKPIDDPTSQTNEIEQIIQITDISMATSGNYRQFYIQDGKKYAHTINPITGYPVQHNLLSATVLSEKCIDADAIATACMVVGAESAISLCESIDSVECYLIFANEVGELQTICTKGFEHYLK